MTDNDSKRAFTLFNQWSNELMNNELGIVKCIYVDLEYLQDLKLGALLHLITVKKEMEYILSKLDEYNARHDYDCAVHFPALKFTDEDLNNLLKDPRYVDMICLKAPFTSVYYDFIRVIDMLQHHNRSVSSSPVDLIIKVNVDNPLYPDELLNMFKASIAEKFKGIIFDITKEPRYTLPLDEYLMCKILYIYNIEEFISEKTSIPLAFIADGKFFDSKIFSIPYINKNLVNDPDLFDRALESTRTHLNLYCDFFYLPATVPKF